jgi:hypothetical protein
MRDRARMRTHLSTVPPNTPTCLKDHGGCPKDYGMRLTLLSPLSAPHSARLSMVAFEAGRKFVHVDVLRSSDIGPFSQFAAVGAGPELFVVANGANESEHLRRLVLAESEFNPEDYDLDGYSHRTKDT